VRRLTALLGLLGAAVGALLTVDPFLSVLALQVVATAGLVLTGMADVLHGAARSAEPRLSGRLRLAAGMAWLAAALTVALWSGATVGVVTRVGGIALVAAGTARLLAARAATVERRAARVLAAAAGVVLGILTLAWPSPTVFVGAVLLGISLVLLSVVDLSAATGFRPRVSSPRRWSRPVAVAVAPILALAVLAVGLTLHAGATRPDAFYAPPPNVPAIPGTLLRSQPLARGAPPGAHAWRILYATTRDEHTPAVASALVLAGDQLPAGPRPVLAWAHGATGITSGCAPTLDDDPLGGGAMPDLDQVLAHGWVVVAPDYPGLGTSGPHPFLIGQGEARAVLDAVRAAHHLSAVTLADRTVVWGHSQGGNAALWAGILAPVYASDAGVIGVAALAPGSNLPVLARLWSRGGSAILGAYLITAYSEMYPDVKRSDYVGLRARLPVGELADRCLSDSKIYLSGLPLLLFGRSIWATDPDTGPFGARLRENVPTGPIAAPVFIGQGEADTVVTSASQAAYVHERCTNGYPVDYRTYPDRGHGDLIASDSPALPYLLQWTSDRLAGAPAASTCPA
jgi:alpha-beta hydrolase superfamily lysophospholipase/uncharacterized membrane protein HdeD (DUF308 family)